MKHCKSHLAVAVVVSTLMSAVAFAQSLADSNVEQIFRLNDDATFQQGCFDPCDCPLQSPLPMRGTMVLGPTMIGDAFNFREISEFNVYVSDLNNNDVHVITGSGQYFITNFGSPPEHGLSLELQIDGGPVQTFFSELEPVKSNDGSFNIQVSVNGLVCFDTVLQVNASPVHLDEIKQYKLARNATYQQGCWDPCDCPLFEPVPMTGEFKLVPLRDLGTYMEYAVVDLNFKVDGFGDPSQGDDDLHITGAGLYTLIAGFAGMIESMDLNLSLDGGLPQQFSSGFINSGEEFPKIDIMVNMNDMVCFDIVMDIKAKPQDRRLNASFVGNRPNHSAH